MDGDQNLYIELDSSVLHEYEFRGADEIEHDLWIPELTKRSRSFLSLPELPLQSSISADLDDFDNQQLYPRKQHEVATKHSSKVVKKNNQPKCLSSLQVLGPKHPPKDVKRNKINQIKCYRSTQVHTISEKKRRHKINGKLKTLQELMPHCQKNEKAYVLEEAVKYIKSLKWQVETMTNPGKFGMQSLLFAQMQFLTNQITQHKKPSPFSTVLPSVRIDNNNNNNNGMLFGAEKSPPIMPFIPPLFPFLPFPFSPIGNFGCLSQPFLPSFGQQHFQPNFVTTTSPASDQNGAPLK